MKVVLINAIWCGGCLVMHKVWEKVKKEYPTLEITTYDFDMDEEIVKTFNTGNKLPVAIFMKDNQEVARLIGEKKVEEIKNILDEKDN